MHSMKTFILFIWMALGVFQEGKTAPEPEEPKVLHLYNWAHYIPQSVIEKFEKETGIKVYYDVFEGLEILEAKLLAARSGYDIVFPSAWPDLARLVSVDIFLPLDFSKIPNAKGLDPVLMKKLAKADPRNEHALPYLWGTTGFAYNVSAVKKIYPDAPVNSLRMLFDLDVLKKLKDCGITLLDSPTEVFEAALLYLNIDPTSERPEDLEKATDLLLKIRPYIKKFDSFQFVEKLISGENCVAQTWSSYGNMAQKKDFERKNPQEIIYVIPEEGSFLWIDVMAIPKDAKHPENAYAFINFILRPEIIAEVTNDTHTANAVLASRSFIQKKILETPGIYPSKKILLKLIVDGFRSPYYERNRLRKWMRIKTGL